MRDVLAWIGGAVVACVVGIVALFGSYELRDRWARRRAARPPAAPLPPVIAYFAQEVNPHPLGDRMLYVDADTAAEAWAAISPRPS